MKINVRVTAQLWENYGFADGGADYWKPKGTQVFNMPIEDDDLMYAENLDEAIQVTLDNQVTPLYKYELIGTEIEWKTPITLHSNALSDALMVV